jgi:hypothetical protein
MKYCLEEGILNLQVTDSSFPHLTQKNNFGAFTLYKLVHAHGWYMNLESIRPRGRPRNRWQDEVREDGRIVSGKEWQEKVYNRGEWKKVLRRARNCRNLHKQME